MPDPSLTPLTSSPRTSGIFLDFDGTLSDIVMVPSDARPLPGVPELLEELAGAFGVVSVISGRSALELVRWLGTTIDIWGVHGAEHLVGGEVRLTEHAEPFAELMQRVRDEAHQLIDELELPGVIVEDKRVMIGLHFRAAADVEGARVALDRIADDLSARHGLLRAGGRLAYELRPPREFSKAAVVLEMARSTGVTAALYAGDDRVDLPAFDALDTLEEEGVHAVRVAVASDEAPPELLDRANVIVDGPAQLVELLRRLLQR